MPPLLKPSCGRLPIMWWQMMTPTPKGEAEMQRMVEEKQKAFVDGVVAAQTQLFKEVFNFWTTPLAAAGLESHKPHHRCRHGTCAPHRQRQREAPAQGLSLTCKVIDAR